MMNKYLVFIPVYNEADSIRGVVEDLFSYVRNVDILIIDDGSTDHTPNVLNGMAGVHTIRHPVNLGYGRTLINGFEFAIGRGYDYLITIDSDKQHQPGEIEKFISAEAQEKTDVISGSRYLNVSPVEMMKAPEDRIKINKRITRIINDLTGYNLTDAFCGFKLYRVEALKRLDLSEPGYGMPLQFWIQAWVKGLTVKEVPVELIYFDHEPTATSSRMNMFRRYRYYLRIIEQEKQLYEYTDYSSAS